MAAVSPCECAWVPTCRAYFFFFNDTATTEIYTLSLHDALPISITVAVSFATRTSMVPIIGCIHAQIPPIGGKERFDRDRKSTRLNSSHANISYAVFCLKKKNTHEMSSSLQRSPAINLTRFVEHT